MGIFMCVLQCLQSRRNGKSGVMIYSHLAENGRHCVWTLLFLIYLSFSSLPHLLSLSSLSSLLFHPSSSLLGLNASTDLTQQRKLHHIHSLHLRTTGP